MKIYKGDVGTKIRLNAGCDISLATVLKILYSKPEASKIKGEWVAVLEGTDYAYYITKEGDLDISGDWKIQLYIESIAWTGYGEISDFKVYDNIKE